MVKRSRQQVRTITGIDGGSTAIRVAVGQYDDQCGVQFGKEVNCAFVRSCSQYTLCLHLEDTLSEF